MCECKYLSNVVLMFICQNTSRGHRFAINTESKDEFPQLNFLSSTSEKEENIQPGGRSVPRCVNMLKVSTCYMFKKYMIRVPFLFRNIV